MVSWRLSALDPIELHNWSSGNVKTVNDLYSAEIFRSRFNLRCECGFYEGTTLIGLQCPKCKVYVTANQSEERRRRIALLRMSVDIRHPISRHLYPEPAPAQYPWTHAIPILPIHYRVCSDGHPTDIGQRYERLLTVHEELAASNQITCSSVNPRLLGDVDVSELEECVTNIIGFPLQTRGSESAVRGTVLGMLSRAVFELDDNIATFARCSMIGLSIEATG